MIRARSVALVAATAFAALGSSIPALAGVTYADLGMTGRVVPRVASQTARAPAGAGSR